MIVSFFGHKHFPQRPEYEEKIFRVLEDEVGEKNAEFYLGDYGDFDKLAYFCCKKYQTTHPNVSLLFITPYITEEYQKNHLAYKSTIYDEIIYPAIEDKPLRFAITYRNKWMAERADIVICGVLHYSDGAYDACKHAKRKNKPIFNVCGIDF